MMRYSGKNCGPFFMIVIEIILWEPLVIDNQCEND